MNSAILFLHRTGTQHNIGGKRVSLELVKLIFGLEIQCEEIDSATVFRGYRGKLLSFIPSPISSTLKTAQVLRILFVIWLAMPTLLLLLYEESHLPVQIWSLCSSSESPILCLHASYLLLRIFLHFFFLVMTVGWTGQSVLATPTETLPKMIQ